MIMSLTVVDCPKMFICFLIVSAATAHLRGHDNLGATWHPPETVVPVNESCHGTVEGENCHAAVMWAMEHSIVLNPECYPDLYQGSSWAEFQLHLHRMGVADCAEPVHTCEKTKPGDRC